MSETPSWLQAGNEAPAPAPAASAPAPVGSINLEPSTGAAAATTEVDDKDLPSIILMMRLLNMGVAGAVIAISIVLLIGIPAISTFVLGIYAICGGLLICCLETQLKFLRVMIAVNFGFLFSSFWRFLFYLILASVCWSYNNLMGKILAACLAGVAVFNTYVLCRYPSYRKIRERIAEEEDKRIEARISKEVKKQAIKNMTGSGK
ncbi:COPI associated protein [Nitzschia inconspicua]|uniref:COPI associated protein n=1 Tax=Nitzschia inconspicua TaxID=303405 RepID=A0A9K3L1B7_9STRA|nr:COPI associated protein [Nitzschia inconspicua]